MLNLSQYGITTPRIIHRNLSPAELYEHALHHNKGYAISSKGAMVALSGEKTGRSPTDKRVVEHPASKENIWWGDINIPFPESSHDAVKNIATAHLDTKDTLYIVDAYAGWDPEDRIKVRVITTRAYHALFMNNMLIRPTKIELAEFGRPDYVIFNGGSCDADTSIEGVTSKTSVSISFEKKEIVILGTEYAGEMKKGVFTVMNYLMPLKGKLSMHSSATAETGSERSAVLFGLSGTGKTTLSADPNVLIITD